MDKQANQPAHPLLPKLRVDSQVANFKKPGIWDERGLMELEKLSDALEVKFYGAQINSIPDMWARPLLFEMALFDEKHLLHKRVLAEWRGMLALLAFNEIKGFNLNIEQVKPPPGSNNFAFLTALEKMAPQGNTLAEDTKWFKRDEEFYPYVIIYDGKPIGMLSPATLVCTASDCANRLGGISWSDGRYLKDPSGEVKEEESGRSCDVNPSLKGMMQGWINKLKDSLPVNNRLFNLIDNYIEDLRKTATPVAIALTENSYGLPTGLFQDICKAIAILKGSDVSPDIPGQSADPGANSEGIEDGTSKKENELISNVQLIPSEGKTPLKRILIVDRAIAGQWNMGEQDIIIFNALTLSDLPYGDFSSMSRTKIKNIELPKNIELRTKKDFFTDKLCLIMQKGALPGGKTCKGADSLQLSKQDVTPLIPLKLEILEYIDKKELDGKVVFRQSGQDIIVSINLTVSGVNGERKIIELREIYLSNQIVIIYSAPVLHIWPNFRSSGWKIYLTYFRNTGEERALYGRPYLAGGKEIHSTPIKSNSQGARPISEITRTEIYPDVIECILCEPGTLAERYVGMILLQQPRQAPQASGKTMNIGVDFGTSSTSVYMELTGPDEQTSSIRNKQKLILHDSLISSVTASGASRAVLYDEFIPGKEERIPFLSFYEEFRKQEKVKDEYNPLAGGHIYVVSNDIPVEDIIEHLTGNIVATNLKWSEEKNDRVRMEAFLYQLCLHAAAEAARVGSIKISWRFSYPTAFSSGQNDSMRKNWENIIKKCGELTGIVQNDPPPRSMTESCASSVYFAQFMDALTTYGAVCIDIGGGTSDIAIWQNNELRHQISLRLAGRNILFDTLRAPRNIDFFKKIFKIEGIESAKSVISIEEYYAKMDVIIGRLGHEDLVGLNAWTGERDFKGIAQIIALSLSGIFYYVGLILRHLIVRGRYTGKNSEPPRLPDIAIGGNGSKLLLWLSGGTFSEHDAINKLFQSVLIRSSGLSPNPSAAIKLKLSEAPKEEAAWGLICDERQLKDKECRETEIISGESFRLNGKEVSWDTSLNQAIFKGKIETPFKFEQVESFLEVFNEYALNGKETAFPPINIPELPSLLGHRLTGKLESLSRTAQQDISIEPLFILALKELIAICNKDLEEKSSKMAGK